MSITYKDNSQKVLGAIDSALGRALERIGLQSESYAKIDCPVDTGNLRNSITHRVDVDEQAAYIGTNVEYAPHVELGTHRTRPQPFLKPAAANHGEVYRRIVEEEMKGS